MYFHFQGPEELIYVHRTYLETYRKHSKTQFTWIKHKFSLLTAYYKHCLHNLYRSKNKQEGRKSKVRKFVVNYSSLKQPYSLFQI